jgi:hypothetical protein
MTPPSMIRTIVADRLVTQLAERVDDGAAPSVRVAECHEERLSGRLGPELRDSFAISRTPQNGSTRRVCAVADKSLAADGDAGRGRRAAAPRP